MLVLSYNFHNSSASIVFPVRECREVNACCPLRLTPCMFLGTCDDLMRKRPILHLLWKQVESSVGKLITPLPCSQRSRRIKLVRNDEFQKRQGAKNRRWKRARRKQAAFVARDRLRAEGSALLPVRKPVHPREPRWTNAASVDQVRTAARKEHDGCSKFAEGNSSHLTAPLRWLP